MQFFKIRSIFSFAAVNKTHRRNVAITSCAVVENAKQTQNLKSWKEIPGPPSLPFVGVLFNFWPGGKFAGYKGIDLAHQMYQLYGPMVRLDSSFGGQDIVFVFDAEAVECVLRSEESAPVRPGLQSLEYYRKRHNKTYDPNRLTGLATDHGKTWRDARTKVNPIMMQPKTIKQYTGVMEEVANDMVASLRSMRNENDKITQELDVKMHLWALESIAAVALGARLNCFDPDLPADSPVKKLVENVHDIFVALDKLDCKPSAWKLYATPTFKKAMRIYEENERLTKHFISQVIETSKDLKKGSAEASHSEKSILEKLLEIDERVAHIMASDMLLAGVDTVSNTALGTLYLLARNPNKQNKLREEILGNPTRRPYLRACIKESMRMLPVASGSLRLSTKEYNLLGYKVPKGVLIVFGHQYMSSMAEHYPRPDEFIPERWLAEKDDPLYHGNAHPLAMAPFGYGIRMCIGRRIAELELDTLISKVIENFQMSWPSDEPLQMAPTSLNCISGPFHFVFKDL